MKTKRSSQFPHVHVGALSGTISPKLYKLTYYSQTIIPAAAYPVCKARQNSLVQAGTHTAAAFAITRAG